MKTYYARVESPVGELLLTSDGDALTGLYINERAIAPEWIIASDDAPIAQATQQLVEYFAGTRQTFDLPLAPEGTLFQKRVWEELAKIPFGETVSYGTIAARLGQPTASRAVGMANGRNPVSIIVPCHRVVGANGTLTGYSGGMPRKKWLLEHETATLF